MTDESPSPVPTASKPKKLSRQWLSLDKHETREKWLVMATMGAALGAIGGVGVGFLGAYAVEGQLALMKDQQSQMQKDSQRQDRNIALITEQTEAARIQASAAAQSAKTLAALVQATSGQTLSNDASSERQRSLDKALVDQQLRARVSALNGHLADKLAPGQPITIRIAFANTGREDGSNLKEASIITVLDRVELAQPRSSESRALAACKNVPLYSNYRDEAPGQWDANIPIQWSPRYQSVIDGQNVLVLAGCSTYLTRGVSHKTSYCYYYDAKVASSTNNMEQCPGGNFFD